MLLSKKFQKIKESFPPTTQLLAVTKNRSIEEIEELYSLGQRHFGENKVQELLDKDIKTEHLKDLKWHMIGTLQNNKVKKLLAIKRLTAIHSLDSLSLAQELSKRNKELRHKVALFWQFNFSFEINKHGFSSLLELENALKCFSDAKNFYHQGLMCMGPATDDEKLSQTEKTFLYMSAFKKEVSEKLPTYFERGVELSMGMSKDFELAIKYGSNWVRLGSILFGE